MMKLWWRFGRRMPTLRPINSLLLILIVIGMSGTTFCEDDAPTKSTQVKLQQKPVQKTASNSFHVFINSNRNNSRKKDLDMLLTKEILAKVKKLNLTRSCNCRKHPVRGSAAPVTPKAKSTSPIETTSPLSTALMLAEEVTTTKGTTNVIEVGEPVEQSDLQEGCQKCCFCVQPANPIPAISTIKHLKSSNALASPIPPIPFPSRNCGCAGMVQPCFECPCVPGCNPIPQAECPCQVNPNQPYTCPNGYRGGVWNPSIEDISLLRQLMGEGFRFLDLINSSSPCGHQHQKPESYVQPIEPPKNVYIQPEPFPYPVPNAYPVNPNPNNNNNDYPVNPSPNGGGYVPPPQGSYQPNTANVVIQPSGSEEQYHLPSQGYPLPQQSYPQPVEIQSQGYLTPPASSGYHGGPEVPPVYAQPQGYPTMPPVPGIPPPHRPCANEYRTIPAQPCAPGQQPQVHIQPGYALNPQYHNGYQLQPNGDSYRNARIDGYHNAPVPDYVRAQSSTPAPPSTTPANSAFPSHIIGIWKLAVSGSFLALWFLI